MPDSFNPMDLVGLSKKPKPDTSEDVQRKLDGVYHRTLWYVPRLDPDFIANNPPSLPDDEGYPSEEADTDEERQKATVPDKANAISSLARSIVPGDEGSAEVHLPCIDLDFPISFEGGFLGIEKSMTKHESDTLLSAFQDARLVPGVGEVTHEGTETLIGPFASRVLCRPSSTNGHFHLYIDFPLTWDTYKGLLEGMAEAQLVEYGYVRASVRRKQSFVRTRKNKQDCLEAAAVLVRQEKDELF